MKRSNVKIITRRAVLRLKTPNAIARRSAAACWCSPPSVGGVKEVTGYIELFDYDVNLLVAALKKTTG